MKYDLEENNVIVTCDVCGKERRVLVPSYSDFKKMEFDVQEIEHKAMEKVADEGWQVMGIRKDFLCEECKTEWDGTSDVLPLCDTEIGEQKPYGYQTREYHDGEIVKFVNGIYDDNKEIHIFKNDNGEWHFGITQMEED